MYDHKVFNQIVGIVTHAILDNTYAMIRDTSQNSLGYHVWNLVEKYLNLDLNFRDLICTCSASSSQLKTVTILFRYALSCRGMWKSLPDLDSVFNVIEICSFKIFGLCFEMNLCSTIVFVFMCTFCSIWLCWWRKRITRRLVSMPLFTEQ